MSFGAGGFIYYALRHNHLICPRCGAGWGKYGGSALPVAGQPYPTASGLVLPVLAEESGSGVQAGSIALGILALLLLVTGVAEGVWVMVVWGVLAGVGAFLLHRASRRARDQRRQALIARLQQDVLRLAGEKRGRLTVTEVASSLAWPMARAEKVLNSLDDGWRVNSTVTDEGMIVYEFLELLRPGDEP
jgi:hypothetical protein